MALPARHDITLMAGDEYELLFRLRSGDALEDLTGKVGRAQIRDKAGPDGKLLAEFIVTFPDVGTVSCFLTPPQTVDLTDGVYDVQIENSDGSGRRTRLAGKVKVKPQVTR